jgi:hypothetical protein
MKNIKDMSPSKDTLEVLEDLLADARSGNIRSFVFCVSYEDDKTGHGWSVDHRNNPKNLISEIQLLNHDFLVNTELQEGKSVLSRALDESDE